MSDVAEIKEYKYQPTDENGRSIGGLQVIKYTTNDELADKLKEQNVLLIRKLRQETKKVRLGIVENEEFSDDTQRYNGPVEFKPRDLTDEERFEISRDLSDPTKAASAATRLIEAQLGVSPTTLADRFNNLEQTNLALIAKVEVNAFIAETPEYVKCPENYETITAYMVRYNLYPSKENFKNAYSKLKDQGLLVEGSTVVNPITPVIEPTPSVEPVVSPVVEPVVQRIPTGFTRDNSSDVGTLPEVGSEIVYLAPNGKTYKGLEAISVMPADEYGRRLKTDRNFGKTVEKLENDLRKNKGR